jgi:hypothetical protein
MVFNDRDYTEEALIKQLTLIELHGKDGSAVDAGCSCIESKHLFAVEGLAEEGQGFALSQKERDFYAKVSQFARLLRKKIDVEDWDMHGIMREVMKAEYPMPKHGVVIGNPHRVYLPHGLTECEKEHPNVVKKLARCIKKVEDNYGCVSPYTDCPVNPVAVCRASIKCP